MQRLFAIVLLALLMNSCVIHFKPGLSICTHKTCVYDAYGLYAIKDFTHRAKAKIARMERKAKRHSHHSTGEGTGIAAAKAQRKPQNKITAMQPAGTSGEQVQDTLIASKPVIPIVRTLKINFAFDKDSISEPDKQKINDYVASLPMKEVDALNIKGFTDNYGSLGYNKHLSGRRAKRVYDYLISLGVPRSKLLFKGFDFKDPIADNKTEEGRALNRRVEIEIVMKESL